SGGSQANAGMPSNVSAAHLEAAAAQLKEIADARVFPILLETALMAFFTVLTVYFVWQRWYSARNKPLVKPMLALALCAYALAMVSWALDIAILWNDVYCFLPLQLSTAQVDDYEAVLTDLNGAIFFAQVVILRFIWFISDCISLWRAYAILGRPRWLLVLSIVILLIEAGLYILNLILNSATRLPSVAPSIQKIVESNDWIAVMVVQSIATAFTAAVLVISTVLIGWRAWLHWQEIRAFVRTSESNRSLAMMAMLVESGVVYTAIWIIYAVYNDVGSLDRSDGFFWSNFYMSPLSAMYPTLVVVLVTTRRSVLEHTLNPPTGALQFAVPLSMGGRTTGSSQLSETVAPSSARRETFELKDKKRDLSHAGSDEVV
ncbi:unnamed protein product, partial [Peniophora sp. CBMAI 1063]